MTDSNTHCKPIKKEKFKLRRTDMANDMLCSVIEKYTEQDEQQHMNVIIR